MSTEVRSLAALLAVVCIAALPSCKRLSGVPERPTWYARASGAMAVLQRVPLTVTNNTVGEDYERGQPTIDPLHHRVFVGSADRGLYALRAEDLSTIWRFQTAGFVQSEPLYEPTEDVVYFGSADGALYKVRAEDGELLFRFATNAEVARKPVLSGGRLYFVNNNDTVLCIDPHSGKLHWAQHRTPAGGMEIARHAGVSVFEGKAFTSFSDGRVFAFDALAGTERWMTDLAAEAEQAGGEVPRYLDSDATPVPLKTASGPVVFTASYAGGVYALDADSGARVWANDRARGVTDLVVYHEAAHPSADGGPAVPARTLLLAASGTTGLWALDINDGHDLWRRPLPEGGVSPPVPVAGAILVATSRYGLFLVSPISGAVIDGIETSSGFSSTPAAYGRRAFAMTNQGVLLGLHIDGPRRVPLDRSSQGYGLFP